MAPRRTGRTRFTLLLLVLTSVTLITLDARGFGPVERLEDGLAAVTAPVRSATATVTDPIGGLWDSATGRDDMRDQIATLEQELAELRQNGILESDAQEDLAALRAQLDVQSVADIPTVIAAVRAGSVSNFGGDLLTINKGTESGIANGMPVLGAGGLVGRIEDAGVGRALVRLVTDSTFAAGVSLVGSDEEALVRGQGSEEDLWVRDGLAIDVDIPLGTAVVTSGVQRSLFPRGIAVGTVVQVARNEAELRVELLVRPSAVLNDIEVVTVLLYDPDNGPVEEPLASPGAEQGGQDG